MNRSAFLLFHGLITLLAYPASLPAQDHRTALLAAERGAAELSRDSGLAVALHQTVDPDVVLLWPGAPVVVGSDEVEGFLRTIPRGGSLVLHWQPLGIELSRDSSLGITWGVLVAGGQLIPLEPRIGRFISVRRRDAGQWRIAALLFLGFPAPPGEVPSGVRPTLPPAAAKGPARPFMAADLSFARTARERGASVAFQRWAAPEAVIFGGGGLLVRGPSAIGRVVVGRAHWTWYPVAGGAAQSGDLGWTVGEAIITPEGAQPDYSKYLTIWRRLPDGRIRFINDGGNARPRVP